MGSFRERRWSRPRLDHHQIKRRALISRSAWSATSAASSPARQKVVGCEHLNGPGRPRCASTASEGTRGTSSESVTPGPAISAACAMAASASRYQDRLRTSHVPTNTTTVCEAAEHKAMCASRLSLIARPFVMPGRLANDRLISCKRPYDNLWSLAAARTLGAGRRRAPPAFVGCISGLDCGARTQRAPRARARARSLASVGPR
jgi:hypothetical protein